MLWIKLSDLISLLQVVWANLNDLIILVLILLHVRALTHVHSIFTTNPSDVFLEDLDSN